MNRKTDLILSLLPWPFKQSWVILQMRVFIRSKHLPPLDSHKLTLEAVHSNFFKFILPYFALTDCSRKWCGYVLELHSDCLKLEQRLKFTNKQILIVLNENYWGQQFKGVFQYVVKAQRNWILSHFQYLIDLNYLRHIWTSCFNIKTSNFLRVF
jgi:hypothetical protein